MKLNRADLDDNPFKQFELWYAEGSASGVRDPSAMALATSGKDGKPSVRMVLMKHFDENGIVFGTSYLSRKATDIEENAHASILFYWPDLERQARLEGVIEKTAQEESDAIFEARSRGSRIAARVSRQSAPVESREVLETALAEETERLEGFEVPRPDFWGGYRIRPVWFEFWQGGANRLHDRFVYRLVEGAWKIERLMP